MPNVNGTVTISINDFRDLENLAEKGIAQLALHKELMARMGQFITALAYDSSLSSEQAADVISKVGILSKSLPNVDFMHDKENARIILKYNPK